MAREALGMDLFDWYGQNPEEAAFFSAAMGNLSALAASELVRVYDVSSATTVADVGGAHGVLLAAVLRANPAARGILFDLPHVVETAGEAIAAQGLSERCDLVAGDFFEAVPEGADLHLLKQIVHDWDDERATPAAAKLPPGAGAQREAAGRRDGHPAGQPAGDRPGDGPEHAGPARGPGAHRGGVRGPLPGGALPARARHPDPLAVLRAGGEPRVTPTDRS
jgi:hypothetical protein